MLIPSPTVRGIAEKATSAYKEVGAVVDVAEKAEFRRKVARMEPVLCIKD
ncbi:MAG: RtcB family protein [Gammaproteobacteria bacterium]